MSITLIVLSALLGIAFLMAGLAKIRQDPRVTDTLVRLGVGTPLQRTIGALEMLGGAGLVVGIWLPMLGVAAGVGLFLLMIGAVGYHLRARDGLQDTGGALVLLVLSGAVLLLRLVAN